MNYGNIKKLDISNGPGIRVSLFVSGCPHHCKGCFNPETWDYEYGKPYTLEVQDEIIELLKPTYIAGLTLLGGEPMAPANQKDVYELIKRVRNVFTQRKTIVVYSGYTLEQLVYTPVGEYNIEILSLIDTLVDGRFIESQKDLRLKFRGSLNQRILSKERIQSELRNRVYCMGC